ncbi:MAG: DUF7009 family protein [Bdellovibrionota bacterium]
MKLRIRGDSIRLRLTRTEVAAVAQGQIVQEFTSFPGGIRFAYCLEPQPLAAGIEASFRDGRIAVTVPLAQAIAWAEGESVALQNSAEELSILIEKDFACLKPRAFEKEDESDMFPNPNLSSGQCT